MDCSGFSRIWGYATCADDVTRELVLKTHIFLCLTSVQQLQCLVGGDCVHPGCVQILAHRPSGKVLHQALPIFYS